MNIIKLMRPKHYLKNALIFVSITFTGNLFNFPILLRVFLGFAAFCLISSAVYIFNDIRDADADRQHEIKKFRPIASGAVGVPLAYGIATALIVGAFWLDMLATSGFVGKSFFLLVIYFMINLGYSFGLKHVPIMDVALLVLGFLLRVLYGAAIIGSGVSAWVYLTVMSLSFYLGLGKRRNELVKNGSQVSSTRGVLKYYTYGFLDKFMYLCLALSIVFYALWSADANIIAKYGTDKLIGTVPIVILLMMKYSLDIESSSYGDPVDVITHDKMLLLLSGIYVVIITSMIYIPGMWNW